MPETQDTNAVSAPSAPARREQQAAVIEEAAERVFITHCAEKTRRGQPLTRQELSRLNAIKHKVDDAPNFVTTQDELAKSCKVSRKTIQRALEKEGHPGTAADGRYEVKPWREFLALTNEHLAEESGPTVKSERARNLMLKNDKLEFEISVLQRRYISQEEVERDTAEMIGEAKKVLNSGPSSLAPQVVGVSIAEAEKLLREWVYSALNQLHNDPLGAGTAPASQAVIVDEPS